MSFPTARLRKAIVENVFGQERALYALLAGTGIRIGEALGLEMKHLSADCRTITIEQSCWEGVIQAPKTKNAYREVDINCELAKLLQSYIGTRQSGFLFANKLGKPLSQTNLRRRSLHPVLKKLKVGKAGFHAMRRLRITWLRKRRAPEDLIRFWIGQAEQSVTDGYSKLSGDVEFRKQVVEEVGTGFVVPACEERPMIPMRPKTWSERRIAVAA
jgi:integrase